MKTFPVAAAAATTPPVLTQAPAPVTAAAPAAHTTDPQVAAALFAAWSGDRFVSIASPPGAGKTRLITHLAEQLHRRAGLNVAIAAQTRAQALDVANRAAAVCAMIPEALAADGPELVADPMVALLGKGKVRPAGLSADAAHIASDKLRGRKGIVVSTTARWHWTDTATWSADVLLIDEAWQLTWADLLALGPLAPQIVCVGDPGQISPVVTGSTQRWQSWEAGPHTPAPDALVGVYGDEVTRQRLPRTWRLGPQTTALLQPIFYPTLPFTSARPDRWLETPQGERLPELQAVAVPTNGGHNDPALPAAAAAKVRELLRCTAHDTDTDSPVGSAQGSARASAGGRALSAKDIAVITPHVAQTAAVAAHLADLPEVLVSTANVAQGLEREAVVVLHPLAGYRTTPDFATDPGRLCVALSRHRCHASVIYDPATPDVLARARREDPRDDTLAAHVQVLEALMS